MAWVGMLSSVGLIFGLVWVSYAVLRLKDVRLRRVLGTLEWLALQAGEPRERGAHDELAQALSSVRNTYQQAERVFHADFRSYLLLAWNATFQELYWANRFGDELRDLALSLLPPPRSQEPGQWEQERLRIIARHVLDFNALASKILLRGAERSDVSEI